MMRTGLQRIEENVEFLKSVPLLKNLNDDVLSKIANVLELVSKISMISVNRNVFELRETKYSSMKSVLVERVHDGS